MDCTNCIYYQACNSIFINFCGKVVNRYKDGCQNFKSNNEFFIIQKQQFAYWIGKTTTSTNIKTTYNDKVQDETVRTIVKSVVEWAQQVYQDCEGPEKLQKALEKASAILNEKGITISDEELNMLIESAVYGLKQGITSTETLLVEGTTEETKEQEAE